MLAELIEQIRKWSVFQRWFLVGASLGAFTTAWVHALVVLKPPLGSELAFYLGAVWAEVVIRPSEVISRYCGWNWHFDERARNINLVMFCTAILINALFSGIIFGITASLIGRTVRSFRKGKEK